MLDSTLSSADTSLQSSSVLQDFFDNAPIGIYTSTPDGRFLAANPAMATLFRYDSPRDFIASVTDITGQLYADPADRQEFKRLVDVHGEVKNQEFRMVRRDGTVIWVSLSGRGIQDSEGNIVQYQGFVSDITGRKLTEDEIINARNQYQSLVDNIPGIAFRCKYDEYWTMLYMSDQSVDLTGYPACDFIHNSIRSYVSVIHPEDRPIVVKSIEDAVSAGLHWDIQYRVHHKDGHFRWVNEEGQGIFGIDGTVAYLDGFILDITERKISEESLLIYKSAVDQSMDGIALADMDGHIRLVNNAWAAMHGYTHDEIIGCHLSLFHTPEQMTHEVEPQIERVIIDGSGQGEIGHLHKDGSILRTQMTLKALKGTDGEYIGLLSSARDITQEVKWREQARFHGYFRTLISEISSRLVLIHNDKTFDEAVDYMLASLGQLFDMDRSYFLRFSDDLSTMSNTHEWCSPGSTAQINRIQKFPTSNFSWSLSCLFELRPLHIPDVKELPEEARAEREEFQFQGIQSLLCLPIYNEEKKIIGFIGFDAVRTHYSWSLEQIALMQMLAEILGNAIFRLESVFALEKSEEKFRFLAENASDFIYKMMIPEGVYEYASPSASRLTGFSPEDFYNNPGLIRKVIHPDWRNFLDEQWNSVLGGNTPDFFEYQIVDKNGESRWLAQSNSYLKDNNGKITSMVGVVRDVTERKRTEQALYKQQALEKILTSLAIGFINVPLEKVDAALDQMLETIGEFTQTDRVYIFQHDASRSVTINTHEWCADGVTPEIGNLQSVPLDLLQVILDPLQKGEIVYIQDVASLSVDHDIRAHFEAQSISSIVAIPLMQGGMNVGFVGFDAVKAPRIFSESEMNILKVQAQIVSNILERLKAEKALHASEQRYRDYILNTPYGLFIADKKGRIQFVNPAACALSGYSEDELISMKISDLLSIEAHKSSLRHFHNVIKKGRAKGEYDMLTKYGDRHWWSVTSVKISNDQFLGFCHDITMRKKAEDQMRLMSTTDDLTGLWNRRHFMQALGREVDRAIRYGHFFSVLLMDIDHFKRVNDKYGHDVGDQALRHFSATIQKGLRQVDILGRLGGEEFGIILPQTDLDGAFSIAERLRKKLERSPLCINESSVSITVSIGLAAWNMDTSMDEILKMADDALYHAKNCGRNQTAKHVFHDT
ncbi:PAS domain S-box protein [Desulfonatronum sp. SC1]|uniref:PAS domain S-box protein n=1 Tax=Desulfonatronum sp. SC1 TaxID=2109626 RepID=UPI000D40502A|nr:PAS domain S-box protein [Desulfonatronum sp. SC1]PTN38899.1 hypothetical protein C6366_00165 [Desulfonatronum sp. SC1]